MTKRLLLSLACSAALLTAPALAQDFFGHNGPDPAALPAWPLTVPTDDILVVLRAEPKVTHKCKVQTLTASALTCSRSLGRSPVVYKPEQVEALIERDYRWGERLWALLPVTIGGAIMYGAVLLNPISEAAAVTVGIIAAVVILTGTVTALWDDSDTPDKLLYLAPGHTLAVTLRK